MKITAIQFLKGRFDKTIKADDDKKAKFQTIGEQLYRGYGTSYKSNEEWHLHRFYGSTFHTNNSLLSSINNMKYLFNNPYYLDILYIMRTLSIHTGNQAGAQCVKDVLTMVNNLNITIEPELSLETQIMESLNNGWSMKGDIIAAADDTWVQTMVKYEEA